MSDPTKTLFQLALGITDPWAIDRLEFDPDKKRLDIHLDFKKGARFACPEGDSEQCPVHDTVDKEWRHLNFFEHEAYLHARVPRVKCENHGVRQVSVPWAREGSGFTLLFEALSMLMMREMPVLAASRILGEQDTRLWRVLQHYVSQARESEDFSGVSKVGVDETSHRKGHAYISLFVDLDRSKLIYATWGKGQYTVKKFRRDLEQHSGQAQNITDFTCDFSPAYREGIKDNFPIARVTADKYHLVQNLNMFFEQVRNDEQRRVPGLRRRNHRYIWLKSPSKLTQHQQEDLAYFRARYRETSRAYELKLQFQDIWQLSATEAPQYLDDWCKRVMRTKLFPMHTFVNMVRLHRDEILRWFTTRISNGVLEGINSLIQATKRRARGYRTEENFIAMAYMIAGKLDFGLPT